MGERPLEGKMFMIQSASFRALVLGALVAGCSSPNASPAPGGSGATGAGSGGGATSGNVPVGPAATSSGAAGGGASGGSSGSNATGSGGASGGSSGSNATGSGGGLGSNATGDAQAAGGTSNDAAPPTRADAGGVGSGDAAGAGADSGWTDPGSVGDGDFTVGPAFVPSPDLTLKAGAPAGFTASFTLTSAMSKIFVGTDFTPPLTFSRQIKIFVPSQYVDGTESPFMVSSDGFYQGLQTVVQNLADDPNPDHHVPPLAIIGIQNGPDVHPNSERSLEYDTVSDRYWRFVTQEVIPAVLANTELRAKFPNFKLTSNPDGRGGYGCSSGGPAVMGLAWFGDFNRVFSFSGSFVALQMTTDHPFGAWEYTGMISSTPARPSLRVFLEVGQNDHGAGTPDSTHTDWVTSNTNMAAALKANGNHYRFILANGAGHCDNNARNDVMPAGLIWLWRGYQAK
jgi:iron(III)-enterobactin esterase